jgi:hypothetical protein
MEMKEAQAVALGARLITPNGQAETAEAVFIKHSSDASVLNVVVNNVNQAINDAIKAVFQFEGVPLSEFKFAINTEFLSSKINAQDITSLVAGWQAGAYSKEVLDEKLVKGGIIGDHIDLEKMNNEISMTPTTIQF